MRYFKSDLLTLLISLFILSSCENPESIGLDVDPENQITGVLIDTASIRSVTVPEDSVLTTDLSQQPLGYMESTVFGTTEANLAIGIALPSDSSQVRFGNITGTGLGLDSAVLVLPYGDEFYGDSVGSTYAVNVHRLNEQVKTQTSYYNTKSWNYNPEVIGAKTVSRFGIRDTIRVTQIRKGRADTVIKAQPQLRIRINNDFIANRFFGSASDNFSSNTKFAEYLKGLYLTINKSQSTGKGGTVFFNPDSSRIELYYRRQSGTDIDTNVLRFPINVSASNTKNNNAGSTVADYINKPNQERVFVQPLSGLRTKIEFPYIQNLKNLGNIAINKAELVIYVDESVNNNPFAPAQRLMLYRTDLAGQRQEVPDNDIGQINGFGDARSIHIFGFGGFYDKTKKSYTFNISSYIQDLVSGNLRESEIDTYIAPIKNNLVRSRATSSNPDPRVADIYPSGTTAGAAILGSGTTNSPYKMKLRIIYTKQGS